MRASSSVYIYLLLILTYTNRLLGFGCKGNSFLSGLLHFKFWKVTLCKSSMMLFIRISHVFIFYWYKSEGLLLPTSFPFCGHFIPKDRVLCTHHPFKTLPAQNPCASAQTVKRSAFLHVKYIKGFYTQLSNLEVPSQRKGRWILCFALSTMPFLSAIHIISAAVVI